MRSGLNPSVEVGSGNEPGRLLEQRNQKFLGGAGVRRGFEHDTGTRPQEQAERRSPPHSTYDRSGAPSRSGVGTVITATSNHAASATSVVTVKRPELSASFTSPSEMSST